MSHGEMKEFTDQNFEKEVLESELPVIVDFWAEWCAPCRMIAPLVEKLAKDYQGKVIAGRFNVDHNPNMARRFRIASIPTFVLFQNGEAVNMVIGANARKVQALFRDAL